MGKKYLSGVIGIWSDDHDCVEAAHKMREAGYKKFDSITPFPVHGMEEAVGIKRSWLGWITFFGGLTGACVGLGFEYWVSVVSWPLNIGGKPFFSAPAFIPIMFELTILFAALSSVVAMFMVNGLPKINPPIIHPDLTSHKFGLWVPETEPGYSPEKVESLLKQLGAEEIRRVAEF